MRVRARLAMAGLGLAVVLGAAALLHQPQRPLRQAQPTGLFGPGTLAAVPFGQARRVTDIAPVSPLAPTHSQPAQQEAPVVPHFPQREPSQTQSKQAAGKPHPLFAFA